MKPTISEPHGDSEIVFQNEDPSFDINDYKDRFEFIVLPPWVEDAIVRNNKPREICTDLKELSSILSMSDVENYRDMDYWVKDLIRNTDNDIASTVKYYNFNSTSRTTYNPHKQYSNPYEINKILFNYFLDTNYASESMDSYYVTLKPYCNNIVAVRLHKANPDENVYLLRVNAINDWISLARKYVSFESIARNGLITNYLNSYSNYLKSIK